MVLELKAALTNSQKCISFEIDKVPNLWLNSLLSSHVTLTSLLNEILQNLENTPEWICEGTTYSLTKNSDTKQTKYYYLFFNNLQTSNIISERQDIFTPGARRFFPLKQIRCRHGSNDCKDQLMINKKILEKLQEKKIRVGHGLTTKKLLIVSLMNGF